MLPKLVLVGQKLHIYPSVFLTLGDSGKGQVRNTSSVLLKLQKIIITGMHNRMYTGTGYASKIKILELKLVKKLSTAPNTI